MTNTTGRDVEELTIESATDFFTALFRGRHHLPSEVRDDERGRFSVSLSVRAGGPATFDNDELTRLVLLAHERCVRAWLGGSAPAHVRIYISARNRTSREVSYAHPTIEQAIAKHRGPHEEWWRVLERGGQKTPTAEERWAAMSPAEQWAMINARPTKIIGPWTRSTMLPEQWCRSTVGGYIVGCADFWQGPGWKWDIDDRNMSVRAPTLREAMERSDEKTRANPEYRGWTIVGGIPADAMDL
ncbi:MAG: hypothetical protein ACHREM_00630 [Polyangiales bacterium]